MRDRKSPLWSLAAAAFAAALLAACGGGDEADFEETPLPATTEPTPAAAPAAAGAPGGAVRVDPALPAYRPAGSLAGTLNSIGSDTLNNLMTLWAEAFRRHHPSVQT